MPAMIMSSDYLIHTIYQHIVNRTSRQLGDLFIHVSSAYFCFLVDGSQLFIMGFFITAVYTCAQCFKKMGEDIKYLVAFKTFTVHDLKYLQKVYDGHRRSVSLLESAFSLAVLIWQFTTILGLCSGIISELGNELCTNVLEIIMFSFGIFRGISIFVTLSIMAQYLTDWAAPRLKKLKPHLPKCRTVLVINSWRFSCAG